MTRRKPSLYYVLSSENPKRMLLGSLKDPSFEDSWLFGRRFGAPPATPVIVAIKRGYEKAELLDYFGTPPVISVRMYETLLKAGVDNLDVYDALLASEDDKIQYTGFKAFNVIGLVKAADLQKTAFSADNESRLIDSSIDSLAIDDSKAKGLLLFRLAEYVGAVVVHESIKRAIEAQNMPYVTFREPGEVIS